MVKKPIPLNNEGKPRTCHICGRVAKTYSGYEVCPIHGLLHPLWHKKDKKND